MSQYKYRMEFDEFWMLEPLDTIEEIPNLSEIQKELNGIMDEIKILLENKNGKKGDTIDKWNASMRIKKFRVQLDGQGIYLTKFYSFLKKRLGVGINLATMLVKLCYFTKEEIQIIGDIIGFQKLIKARTIPQKYKKLIKDYKSKKITKQGLFNYWMSDQERISIKI